MRKLFTLLVLFLVLGGVNSAWAKAIYKFTLDEQLTFEQALESTEGVAIVHNSRILCNSADGLRMVDLENIDEAIAWHSLFVEGTGELAGSYFIKNVEKAQYVNASIWSHAYLSGLNPDNGEKTNGALWNIAVAGEKTYTIRNLGAVQGNYDTDTNVFTSKGWLADITTGYWADHATWQNEVGDEWTFYTLKKELVANTSWTFTKISLEDALTTNEYVVMRNINEEVAYGPFGTWNDGIQVSKSDFDEKSFAIKIEQSGDNYTIKLNENDSYNRYIQASQWGHSFLNAKFDNDGSNTAVWTIASLGDNTYSIKSLGVTEGSIRNDSESGYLYVNNEKTLRIDTKDPYVWEFYTVTDPQIIPIDPNTPTYDKVEADLTTFALANRTGNTWSFATPISLFDYKYMVVVTKEASGNKNGYMILTDKTGKRAGNNWDSDLEINYVASSAGTRGGMWLDRWNNQICACINLDWISKAGLDIKNISSFEVPNGDNIAGIFLTNYEDANAVKNIGGTYPTGDHSRSNGLLDEETAKFGTVALKYTSVVSGAKLYTVDEWHDTYMVLAEKSDYIAEAGVPYIFATCDFEGMNADGGNKGTASNVNFYRVDANAVSGDWSDNNARDNGLVGYYDGGFWPGAGKLNGTYLLSNNQLHKVDSSDNITLGANRCFFDPAKYQGPKGTGSVRIRTNGNDANAIDAIQATKVLNSDKIYNLNGQEVKTMQKGQIYIMGGMKIRVK